MTKDLFLCAALALAAFSARAADTMACPPWEITVVDEAGKPVAGCTVVQEWGCDFQDVYLTASTNAVTDATGRIRFPARFVSPPVESKLKKLKRTIDRTTGGEPAASAFVSKSGCKFEWLNSRSDARNVTTREGLRSRVVLKTEKP